MHLARGRGREGRRESFWEGPFRAARAEDLVLGKRKIIA